MRNARKKRIRLPFLVNAIQHTPNNHPDIYRKPPQSPFLNLNQLSPYLHSPAFNPHSTCISTCIQPAFYLHSTCL